MSEVMLREIHSYDLEKLLPAVEEFLIKFELDKKIKPGMQVVIKPNLVIRAAPDSGVITHPMVAAAAGLAVQKLGAKVLIAESNGDVFAPARISGTFAHCGYEEMAKRYGFELYTACKHSTVAMPHGVLCRKIDIVDPFLEADFIINVAKFKSHCMTRFSGAVKNLFGTVPGLKKTELHCRFPQEETFVQMLVDLCDFLKPGLSIIDGIDGMEGDGPTGGEKRHMGLLAASCDPFALDVAASTIANMKPDEIPLLRNAMDRGLCPKSVGEVDIDGNLVGFIQKDFKQPRSKTVDFIRRLPKFLRPLAKKVATPKPAIRHSQCIGCGKCVQSCPQNSIKIVAQKAVIDYTHCIKCFCCHEMCPMHVIDVKRFSLFNL